MTGAVKTLIAGLTFALVVSTTVAVMAFVGVIGVDDIMVERQVIVKPLPVASSYGDHSLCGVDRPIQTGTPPTCDPGIDGA